MKGNKVEYEEVMETRRRMKTKRAWRRNRRKMRITR